METSGVRVPGDDPETLKIKEGLAGKEKLRSYDTDDDSFSVSRYRKFVLYVIAPSLGLCVFFVWLLFRPTGGMGGFLDAGTVVPTSVYGSKLPAAPLVGNAVPSVVVRVGGSMFGSGSPDGGGGFSRDGRVDLAGIRCYARDDARGVYSDTLVLKEGMVIPTQFTRVNGGMIFSPKYGWLRWGQFGCAGDLMSVEIEFSTPVPTKTVGPTRRPVTVAPVVPSPLPSPTFTPTPYPGIVRFEANGSELAWLVWGVDRVYLEYGGRVAEGVRGDLAGGPVFRNVYPYTGTVTLRVIKGSVQYVRSVVVQ